MKSLFILLLITLSVALAVDPVDIEKEWKAYKEQYNKSYETKEEDARHLEIYLGTKAKIAEHNAKYAKGEVTWTMGINQFADQSPEELKKMLGIWAK